MTPPASRDPIAISSTELAERDALGTLEAWARGVSEKGGVERYRSPDGRSEIELRSAGEPSFGPSLYRVRLVRPSSRNLRISGSYLSPGRFGSGWSQFGGSPFSPDSNKIALVRVESGREPTFHGCILAGDSGRELGRYRSHGPLLHHSWSPDSRFWLGQELGAWVLWDTQSDQASVCRRGRGFPKHAAFRTGTRVLTFDEETGTASVFSVPDWSVVKSHRLLEVEGPCFSFPARQGTGLVLGCCVRFDPELSARQWLLLDIDEANPPPAPP